MFEFLSEVTGHDTVDKKSEAGIDTEQKLGAVIHDQCPERIQVAVLERRCLVVPARQTLLKIQCKSVKERQKKMLLNVY